MQAPNQTTRSHRGHRVPADDGPLRLRMADHAATGTLDGVWWPRSRELAGELADLVDHFPADRLGRIVRVLVSPPDWDTQPRHVLVRGGYVKVGVFPQDADAALVHLITTDRTLLHVLVVPPAFTRDQGNRALRAATTRHRHDSATSLLDRAARHLSGDSGEQRGERTAGDVG